MLLSFFYCYLKFANTKPTLLDGLLKRRLAFHGHLVRKGGITLDLMIGRLHGTRPRGRPRTTWLKDLTTHANISYKESMTIPRDRKKWRSVGNPRRTPDEWVSEWVIWNLYCLLILIFLINFWAAYEWFVFIYTVLYWNFFILDIFYWIYTTI